MGKSVSYAPAEAERRVLYHLRRYPKNGLNLAEVTFVEGIVLTSSGDRAKAALGKAFQRLTKTGAIEPTGSQERFRIKARRQWRCLGCGEHFDHRDAPCAACGGDVFAETEAVGD